MRRVPGASAEGSYDRRGGQLDERARLDERPEGRRSRLHLVVPLRMAEDDRKARAA